MIGLDYGNQPNLEVTKKFIVPVDQYREVIVSRVLHLRTDRFIYVNQRNHCSFGQALHMAVTLCEGLPITARIVLLAGGPCTYGPGVTISPDFKQQMRSAEELSRGENLPHFASAKQYYDGLLKRVISRKIVIDLFAFSLNEIGFTEMSDLIIDSGGYVVMHEEFSDRIFKESFGKVL